MELDFSDKIKELLKLNSASVSVSAMPDPASKMHEQKEGPNHESKEVEDEDEDEDKEEGDEEGSEENGQEEKTEALKKAKTKKVVAFLQKKIDKHNETQASQISLEQLLKVYARGLEQANHFFRPGKTKDEWAFARVTLFLRMASNQYVNASYAKADSDILNNQQTSENYEFSQFLDIDFQLAKLSCIEAGLSDSEMEVSLSEDKKKRP